MKSAIWLFYRQFGGFSLGRAAKDRKDPKDSKDTKEIWFAGP